MDDGIVKLFASISKCFKYVDEEECSFIGNIITQGHEFVLEN